MDLSVGFGIIATLLGILGAFDISREWRNQKSSEEISKECKDLVIKLYDLKTIYIRLNDIEKINRGLLDGKIKSSKDIRIDFFNSIKEWNYNSKPQLEFILILIKNKSLESKCEELINQLNDFESHMLIQRLIGDEDLKELIKHEEIINYIENIIKLITPYIRHSKSV